MLIELLKPRRNNTPVTLPDGSSVQFNEDEFGHLVAEVANDQALLILAHKDLYARAGKTAPAAPVEDPVETEPPVEAEMPVVRHRGLRKTKG